MLHGVLKNLGLSGSQPTGTNSGNYGVVSRSVLALRLEIGVEIALLLPAECSRSAILSGCWVEV
eukprot:1623541-Rhodomonas_salina.1